MAATGTCDGTDARTALADLPPSAKLVATVLAHEGELTQAQLAEETLLPPRTVRSGLSELDSAGLVDSRISFVDARQRIYDLDGTLHC
ncbi:ArsR family transcriptional regulator [Salinarchaeum sp. Harcht-Bsk1]|uniref:MarR family transcriptional regulator n=1 Tax=Salinarchaeum sp. Harcht-Bsk1 TaxID=1333523 RepID=UPI000342355B|nr:helix-turn-helix domain-containing protein [Salinarchaeum sp. Harcht-Bsk1]AGN00687.1 ArsR family transcriptional regulator [Salinarchaeum sp. Harcht-Bsk1]